MRVLTSITFIGLLANNLNVINGWTSRSNNAMSRQEALVTIGSSMVAAWLISPPAFAEKLPSGVTYEVIKNGDGPKPEIGELIAIRFAAFCGSNKIDDIFDTPEPYYTRLGSGGLLKGVETTLPLMRVGDRWRLEIPGELAFGSKGRPASAGKPRIPADATITFEVEVVGLPGKEPELIELIGDD